MSLSRSLWQLCWWSCTLSGRLGVCMQQTASETMRRSHCICDTTWKPTDGNNWLFSQWWAVINYFLVTCNYVIKLLWRSEFEKFNYSKVIGNWVVVKLLFKVVNYQVLKSSWRSFCLPVDSYPFTYLTGTVYWLITTVLLKWDRPTWYKTMQLDRLTMKQLLCAHGHQHSLSDD